MPEMSVIDTSGDTKVIWDPNNLDEVEAARAMFEKLNKKGYMAYQADGEKGEKGKHLKQFDPMAARIIMVPMMTRG